MDKRRIYLDAIFLVLVIFFQNSSAGIYLRDDDEGSWSRCPVIRHKLKNGRVKIRSGGRVAKFQCDPGYDLAGNRFATCVRGQWNHPIPICVGRGCSRRPNVLNSRVSESMRGAVLTYECLPGFTLATGSNTIYCDGRRWSQGTPKCEVSTLDPKVTCDFEATDLCGWSHDPTHDFDWRRNQYKTPSGHLDTGPTFDHTFGEGRGGMYLYMETSSPRKQDDTARLFSPVYSAEHSGGCFTFWYHMYGRSTGYLRVYIKPTSQVFGELASAWERVGAQGNEWFMGNISVPELEESFQIVIEGIRGDGYEGDTAIDDVSLNSESCRNVENSNETESDVDSASCRGRCLEHKSDICACDDYCSAENNCCHDYTIYCYSGGETTENTDELPRPPVLTTEADIHEEDHYSLLFTTESSSLPDTITFVMNTSISIETSTKIEFSSAISSDENHGDDQTEPFSPTTIRSSIALLTTLPATTPESTTITPIQATTTEKQTTTTPKPTTTTPKPTTTTTMPTTTTPITTTTTTPKPTTTTPIPITSTPKPATIAPSTSTPAPTTSAPTTTSTPSTTTTITSAPIPITKQTTTTASTTSMATVPFQVSTASTSTSGPDVVVIVTQTPETVTVPPSSTSIVIDTPTTVNVPETRRTYNFRPRNRTTSTTPMPARRTTRRYITTSSTKRTSTTPATTPVRDTTKVPIPTTTQRSKFKLPTDDASAFKDAHPSKEASTAQQPVVTILSVIVVVMIVVGVGGVYLFKKWRIRKQLKLADDSEMRFLSENEVIEFSDPSAIDRHNFHQPLIN